jgi:membrane associated rhomboid family serine protease
VEFELLYCIINILNICHFFLPFFPPAAPPAAAPPAGAEAAAAAALAAYCFLIASKLALIYD